VMSCAPAYVALFAEALASAGAREGLDRAEALVLVAATLSGTGELLSRHEPAAIRRVVASPGGATEAGLEALEQGGFTKAVDDAVDASLERFR
jgi:pyrroline-5-carboxylate reductase